MPKVVKYTISVLVDTVVPVQIKRPAATRLAMSVVPKILGNEKSRIG